MRLVKKRVGRKCYTIRAYDIGGLVIDSWMMKLAYHVSDDYCNPPGFFWAELIIEPMQAMNDIGWSPRQLWPQPTPDEWAFLASVRAVIVKAGKRPSVEYFHSLEEAKRAWIKLKAQAEGLDEASPGNRS